MLERLVQPGADSGVAGEDVNEVDAAGVTPLHCAAWCGWEEGVRVLLRLGAKVGTHRQQPITDLL